MSAGSRRIPKYRHYKPKNLAVVRIDGKDHYLGKHGSPQSWERYHRLVAEWLNGNLQRGKYRHVSTVPDRDGLAVSELILAYWSHAQSYYVKNGRPTDEQAGIRAALRRLRRSYGSERASDFGPLKLKSIREAMIEEGLSRGVINQYINRIRRMFKWAVENELIPVEVYQALMTVGGLRKGRTAARETPEVKPVPEEDSLLMVHPTSAYLER